MARDVSAAGVDAESIWGSKAVRHDFLQIKFYFEITFYCNLYMAGICNNLRYAAFCFARETQDEGSQIPTLYRVRRRVNAYFLLNKRLHFSNLYCFIALITLVTLFHRCYFLPSAPFMQSIHATLKNEPAEQFKLLPAMFFFYSKKETNPEL